MRGLGLEGLSLSLPVFCLSVSVLLLALYSSDLVSYLSGTTFGWIVFLIVVKSLDKSDVKSVVQCVVKSFVKCALS